MKGRKTLYKKDYCDLLLKHMKDGNSYTSFAARVSVHIDTLYEWEKKHSEFSEAKKEALMHAQAFWEDIGRKMALDGNFNAWKFNMKNRFGWRDTAPDSHVQPQEIRLAYKLDEKPKHVIQLDEDDMDL